MVPGRTAEPRVAALAVPLPPGVPFPYQRLIDENARRSREDPEFELLDTGVFDQDKYWVVEVTYAKASPTDVLARITVENKASHEADLSVLPTVWFRNNWRFAGGDVPSCVGTETASSWTTPGSRAIGFSPDLHRTARSPKRCSVTTRRTPLGCSGPRRSPPTPRTGSTTTSSAAPAR